MSSLFAILALILSISGTVSDEQQGGSVVQQTPSPAPATPASVVQEVTVTANRDQPTSSNGTKVYRVRNDLQATTGTASDVLKNIPSVEVDPDGGVSLRGDPNVQILIDGVPSAQMSGSNRGAALQDFPGDQIERIEVITTPTAAEKSEGSGGIINIITKKRAGLTASGTASVLLGGEGRKSISLSEQRHVGPWSLSGSIGVRRDENKIAYSETASELNLDKSLLGTSSQTGSQLNKRWVPRASGNADIDVTKADHLNFSASYVGRVASLASGESDQSLDSAGAVATRLSRSMTGQQQTTNTAYGLIWQHKFPNSQRNLKLSFQYSRNNDKQSRNFQDSDLLQMFTDDEAMRRHVDFQELEGQAAYSFRLFRTDVKLGYDYEWDNVLFADSDSVSDPVSGLTTSDPSLTNRSRVLQTIDAEYVTFQRDITGWTVNAGLRAEETQVATTDLLSNTAYRQNYINVMPSLNIEHAINGRQKVHFGYDRRLDRPPAQSLTDYEISLDAYHLERGNPSLMPQQTDSFEGSWEWRDKQASATVDAYFRKTDHLITETYSYVTPPVIVEVDQNLGRLMVTGAEVVGSQKLLPSLKINGSATVYYNKINAVTPLFAENREGMSYLAKLNLDWTPEAKDTFQINMRDAGRHYATEGYFSPSWVMNIGYRRAIDNRLSLTATLSDIFNSERWHYITDIPILERERTRRLFGRVFWAGLSWKFGEKHEANDSFDYEN